MLNFFLGNYFFLESSETNFDLVTCNIGENYLCNKIKKKIENLLNACFFIDSANQLVIGYQWLSFLKNLGPRNLKFC